MKNGKNIILAVILSVVVPGLFLRISQPTEDAKAEATIITVLTGDTAQQMDIEEYLVGVLLGEMPENFEDETLKAQAVAARTFTLYNKGKGWRHQNGDICTSATCCQAYISPENYISSGGEPATVLRMAKAVKATKSQVLLYENSLIEATYFSSSGGRTEDAQAVWGVFVPYLQSVESGEEDMSYTTEISKEDFCMALGLTTGDVRIEAPIYTNGGGIDKVCINGEWFSGMQLRQKLGLRSTQISFYAGNGSVKIVTKGYGHRVGMSQYGADAMAAGGCDYKEILLHYYSGVTIGYWTSDNN